MQSSLLYVTRSFLSVLFLSFALGVVGCGETEEVAECGNGQLETFELCDDGNEEDGDGCSSECVLEGGNEIDAFFRSIAAPLPPQENEVVNSFLAASDTADGNFSCSSSNVTKTVPLDAISVVSTTTSTLYPGALLRGDTLSTGQFAEVAFDRAPMTYSLSIQDGSSAPRSATMSSPTLSEFRDTIGEILVQANLNEVPIKASASIQEVRSEQDLNLALAANANTATVDVQGAFNFESIDTLSRFLVTIDMAFFTADVDAIINPSDLFTEEVTLEEVRQKFSGGEPPLYVSSITYGTRFYLAVESSLSEEEMNAALSVAFNGAQNDVDGSVSVSTQDRLQTATMRFAAVGASQDQLDNFGAVLAAQDRLAALQDFMSDAQNFSASNLGEALSFTLKTIGQNAPVAVAFTGTSDILTCERISQNVQASLQSIKVQNANDDEGVGQNNTLEIFGDITVQGDPAFPAQALLDLSGVGGQQLSLSAELDFVVSAQNQAQHQKTLRIDPRNPNATVRLVADFIENDTSGSDENIPPAALLLDKNSTGGVGTGESLVGKGFSGEYSLVIPSVEGQLTVTFTLRPVP